MANITTEIPLTGLDPGQTVKRAYSADSKANRVLVANSEIPVVYDYVTFYYDTGNRPYIAEYFINGTRAAYNIIFTAEDAVGLQGKHFTLRSERNTEVYDIIYSVDSADVPTTGNPQVVVNVLSGDIADNVAINTAVAIDLALRWVDVTVNDNIVSFCNYFVGSIIEPQLNSTGFTLSDFTNGTDGICVGKKKHTYTGPSSECILYSDVVTYDL